MSAGFWHSADLRSWEYRASTKLAPLDYAPDVPEVNGARYWVAVDSFNENGITTGPVTKIA